MTPVPVCNECGQLGDEHFDSCSQSALSRLIIWELLKTGLVCAVCGFAVGFVLAAAIGVVVVYGH